MSSEAKENLRLFLEFAKRGQIPQMEEFLAMKVPVNGTDHLGQTALHWSASCGYDESSEWLVSQGANVDATSKDGDTPLHKASWRGHPSACSVLIAKGANRKIKNAEGKAALDLAKTPAIKRVCTPLPELGATTNPLQRAMEEAAAAAASGEEIEDVPDDELFNTED